MCPAVKVIVALNVCQKSAFKDYTKPEYPIMIYLCFTITIFKG